MPLRAVRGATTVAENRREAILEAATELLESLIEANRIEPAQVVSATFTATPDLDQAYPAEAARALGWTQAALLCVQEMQVQGSLPRALRVLVLWETDLPRSAVAHRYLRGASGLRPDLPGG